MRLHFVHFQETLRTWSAVPFSVPRLQLLRLLSSAVVSSTAASSSSSAPSAAPYTAAIAAPTAGCEQ